MSVQAGIWNLRGEPIDRGFLTRISQTLAEYGPDGEAVYSDGLVCILYRPYYTTPESRTERQPYISRSGKIITWDGRLDNRDELIRLLENNLIADRTDVALVAAAFDQWGTDCFSKLIGDWAISIWDPHERALTMSRDYMGIRHLFYYPKREGILWCSHLAPLALCGDQFTLCDEYIAGYLASHPEAHLTPYREIHSVPPGKFVLIQDATISIHTYWEFNARLTLRYKTDAEYDEHYRHLFRQAVRRRLRTDAPMLAELSGGLDSSSVVCMADNILSREGAETPRVDTFSYYDSNEPDEDDFVHLTKVEDKRGKRGLRVDLKGSGDSLPLECSIFTATPGFGSRAEVKAAISHISSYREYRTMLCGTGGDEVNGQPMDPRILMADLLVHCRWAELAKQLIAWSLLTRTPLIQLFLGSVGQLLPRPVRSALSKKGRLEPWINPEFAHKHRVSARELPDMEGLWFLRPAMRDTAYALVILSRVMTYLTPSLIEQRYPYLDQTLVEFLAAIPSDQLLRPGQRRLLMRRALASILPPEIAARKTKTGAARCYSVTLEKHWSKLEEIFAFPLTARLGYVNQNRIHEALLGMKRGQVPTHFLRLLKALSLELWLRDVQGRHMVSIQATASPTVGGTSVAELSV